MLGRYTERYISTPPLDRSVSLCFSVRLMRPHKRDASFHGKSCLNRQVVRQVRLTTYWAPIGTPIIPRGISLQMGPPRGHASIAPTTLSAMQVLRASLYERPLSEVGGA